jgi:hypothetical protein
VIILKERRFLRRWGEGEIGRGGDEVRGREGDCILINLFIFG